MANPILSNGLASPQSIYEEVKVTTAGGNQTRAQSPYGHNVGDRSYLPDGRVFYYATNGAVALTTGSLLAIPATIGLNRIATHDKIVLTASSGNFVAGAKEGIALHEADVDTNDIVKDEYADGYLTVQDVTGEGQCRKIRSHSAFDASGTATTGTFDLYDPLSISLAATSQISLGRNPYDRMIASGTAEEEGVMGAAPIAVTASTALATDVTTTDASTDTYFFWCQTWGPAAVQVSGTAAIAGAALTSGTTAKAALPSVAASLLMLDIGLSLQSAPSTLDFILADLRCRP